MQADAQSAMFHLEIEIKTEVDMKIARITVLATLSTFAAAIAFADSGHDDHMKETKP